MTKNNSSIINGFLFFLFFLNGVAAVAQDFKEDSKKMKTFFSASPELYIDIRVESYQEKPQGEPIQTEVIKMRRSSATEFFYRMRGMDMLMSETHMLTVDHQGKEILLKELTPDEKRFLESRSVTSNVDSLLSYVDSVVYDGVFEKSKRYSLFPKTGIITKVELYLQEKNTFPDKIVYYYDKKLSPESGSSIIYFSLADPSQLRKDLYVIPTYVVSDSKKTILTPKFSSYHLTLFTHE